MSTFGNKARDFLGSVPGHLLDIPRKLRKRYERTIKVFKYVSKIGQLHFNESTRKYDPRAGPVSITIGLISAAVYAIYTISLINKIVDTYIIGAPELKEAYSNARAELGDLNQTLESISKEETELTMTIEKANAYLIKLKIHQKNFNGYITKFNGILREKQTIDSRRQLDEYNYGIFDTLKRKIDNTIMLLEKKIELMIKEKEEEEEE